MIDGLYVAAWVPPAQAQQLAIDGGEPAGELHVTIAYIPGQWQNSDLDAVTAAVAAVAAGWAPLQGSVCGLGVWPCDDGSGDVLYGSANVPGLDRLRSDIVDQLTAAGYPIATNNGFSPHVTLAYLEPGSPADVSGYTPMPLTLDSLSVVTPGASQRETLPFPLVQKDDPTPDSSHVDVPLGSQRKKRQPAELDDVDVADVKLVKADDEQRLVYGIVLEPDTIDTQGDWETADDIEKAAHRYLAKGWQTGGAWNTLQHRLKLSKGALVPVESFVAPCDFVYPESPGDVISKGSWVLVAKVQSDALWQHVKDGTFSGWSVGGTGRRDASQPSPAA